MSPLSASACAMFSHAAGRVEARGRGQHPRARGGQHVAVRKPRKAVLPGDVVCEAQVVQDQQMPRLSVASRGAGGDHQLLRRGQHLVSAGLGEQQFSRGGAAGHSSTVHTGTRSIIQRAIRSRTPCGNHVARWTARLNATLSRTWRQVTMTTLLSMPQRCATAGPSGQAKGPGGASRCAARVSACASVLAGRVRCGVPDYRPGAGREARGPGPGRRRRTAWCCSSRRETP